MNAIVIVIRGLSAWATGPYGCRWVETPSLDGLAARGVVYDLHFAAHPGNRTPWRTGRHAFADAADASPGPDLLAALRTQGVRTFLLHQGPPPPAEFLDGWDEVHRARKVTATVDAVLGMLRGVTEEDPPFLLWVEFSQLLPPWKVSDEVLDAYFLREAEADEDEEDEDEEEDEEEEIAPAEEYLPPEEELQPLLDPPSGEIDSADDNLFLRVRKSYGAAVTDLDIQLGELLDLANEKTLLIVTSDAGQALGEHGFIGPGRPWLYHEVTQVPLVLAGAGCPAGIEVPGLTLSLDLPVTLATYFGATLSGTHGRDLLDMARQPTTAGREFVCLGMESGGAVEWAIRTPDWFLRLPHQGTAQLYVKPDDQSDAADAAQQHFAQTETLERTLREHVAALHSSPSPPNPV